MYEGLLVRVGIDSTSGGWVAPCNSETGEYMFVPMGHDDVSPDYDSRYTRFKDKHASLIQGKNLPKIYHFPDKLPVQGHFDPDTEYLTYGDWHQRARRIQTTLGNAMQEGKTSFIAFYSSFRDVLNNKAPLEYGIWGIYFIDRIVKVGELEEQYWDWNEHSRIRRLPDFPPERLNDIVVFADKTKSVILDTYIPIGEWRDRMYRVKTDLLNEWGDLDVHNGYIQRSAFLPKFKEPAKFLQWFENTRNN